MLRAERPLKLKVKKCNMESLHMKRERIPRGELPYKKEGDVPCSSYLLGVKSAVLVPLRVFGLNRSTAGAFAVPFRVLSRKNRTEDNLLS